MGVKGTPREGSKVPLGKHLAGVGGMKQKYPWAGGGKRTPVGLKRGLAREGMGIPSADGWRQRGPLETPSGEGTDLVDWAVHLGDSVVRGV